MAQHEVFKRYALIFTRISHGNFPTFREIQEYLENFDIQISPRSIQRDIYELRLEFGIEILFDRGKNGYYLDKNSGRYMQIFLHFLNAVQDAQALADCLKEGKKNLETLSLESEGNAGGAVHLPLLMKAIKKRNIVTFVHENFFKARKKIHTVRPYLLKEYQRRWYLIGNYSRGDDLWAFGLDRVTDLVVTSKTFNNSDHPDPAKTFASTIGVSYSEGGPVEIILSMDPDQGKYFKTVPLHRSQKVLIDDEREFRFSVNVVPNYELIQRILMMGETAKVIKPASLAREVKETLKAALKKYT